MHRRKGYFTLAAIAAADFQCEAFAPPPLRAVTSDSTSRRFGHSASSHRPAIISRYLRHNLPTSPKAPSLLFEKRKRPMLHSAAVDDQEKAVSTKNYIRPYLKQLFLLCRPVNFPIVALFHVLGVHQAARFWESTSASSPSLLIPLLKHPSMIMVLLSLLLVTSTSMITNDYYDARNGVDDNYANAEDVDNNENDHYHPLARGEVPFSVAKTFDSYLYAVLLLSSAFVPGVISRLFVLGGAIITYLYTVHLKPRTWIKNLSCAALVAMSPVTSGLAAWCVLCEEGGFLEGGLGDAVSAVPFHLIFRSPLSFLVVALFAGIMSREILMDITDCEGDAQAGIETVPVQYGKRVASRVALGCSFISAISACGASLIPWIQTLVERGEPVAKLITVPSISSLTSLLTDSPSRKVVLSLAGSGMLLQRTYSVWKTKGDDANLCERAIRESLVSVLLVLASFL